MGKRLTQIATRTGDDGTTGLGDNTRVSKDSLRVHAMGDVDELNSHIGLLLCEAAAPTACANCWWRSSTSCSTWAASCRSPASSCSSPKPCWRWTKRWRTTTRQLPRLQEFILPAGNRAASQAHVCRTVARRAERAVVALGGAETLRETPRQYLNRLSDLLFVLARVLNRMNGGDDVYWKSEKLKRAAD